MTGGELIFLSVRGMLAGLIWRPKISRYAVLVLVETLAVATVFFAAPIIGNRFIDAFTEQLPTQNESPYYRVFHSGLATFDTAPILELGQVITALCVRILCRKWQIEPVIPTCIFIISDAG